MQSGLRACLVFAIGIALSSCEARKLPETSPAASPDAARPTASPLAAEPAVAVETPALPSAPPPLVASAPPAARETAPGTTASAACESRKQALKARFTEASSCQADADCERIEPGCPFGCGLALNRATNLTKLTSDIRAYRSECNECVYRCRPPAGAPICERGTCAFSRSTK